MISISSPFDGTHSSLVSDHAESFGQDRRSEMEGALRKLQEESSRCQDLTCPAVAGDMIPPCFTFGQWISTSFQAHWDSLSVQDGQGSHGVLDQDCCSGGKVGDFVAKPCQTRHELPGFTGSSKIRHGLGYTLSNVSDSPKRRSPIFATGPITRTIQRPLDLQVLTGQELFDQRPASVPAFAPWTLGGSWGWDPGILGFVSLEAQKENTSWTQLKTSKH